MFSVFLSSYRNIHESLGELEKAVETLAGGSSGLSTGFEVAGNNLKVAGE